MFVSFLVCQSSRFAYCVSVCLFVYLRTCVCVYSKTCLKRPLKHRQNKDLNDKLELNEDRKYSAIVLICIKRLLVLKPIFGLCESVRCRQGLLFVCVCLCICFVFNDISVFLRLFK